MFKKYTSNRKDRSNIMILTAIRAIKRRRVNKVKVRRLRKRR